MSPELHFLHVCTLYVKNTFIYRKRTLLAQTAARLTLDLTGNNIADFLLISMWQIFF